MKKRYLLIWTLLLSFAANLSAQSYGVVNFSVNFMREAPDYTAELGDQALMGTVVEILDQQGYWLKIKSPEPYTAWVNDMGIVRMDEKELAGYIRAPKYICIADHTYMYSRPDSGSERVTDLVMGDLLRIQFNDKGNRPVHRKGWSAALLPSGIKGYVRTEELQEFKKWAESRVPSADNIIRTARTMLGVPYFWGGTSTKGVDCSGLVRTSCFMNGLLLPRNASQQAKIGDAVEIGEIGNRTIENLERGDLLFFGNIQKGKVTHVGIYLGDGLFIHSSLLVRINHLIPTETDKYNGIARLLYARRIINQQDKGKGIISITESPYYFAD